MKDAANHDASHERIEHEAAAWVLRCDRGLTPAEQDAMLKKQVAQFRPIIQELGVTLD